MMAGIMPKLASYFYSLVFLTLSACGRQTPALAPTTFTPDLDPCASQNLPAALQEINGLMREFDSVARQDPGTSFQQLPEIISDLQRIRRAAEDLPIPPCLRTLKTHQLNHMNLMIQTLLAVVGGGDQQTLNTGLAIAQAEYERYSLELVRLLGITLAPITETPASSDTP